MLKACNSYRKNLCCTYCKPWITNSAIFLRKLHKKPAEKPAAAKIGHPTFSNTVVRAGCWLRKGN